MSVVGRVLNLRKALFLSFVASDTSVDHHGTRFLDTLDDDRGIEFRDALVIVSVKFSTKISTLLSFAVLYMASSRNIFQSAFLSNQRGSFDALAGLSGNGIDIVTAT